MPTLADILAAAERDAYRGALVRHGGSIKAAASELGVDRKTASRAVERLGLRAWLDATYPHRDPATVGRRGDVRRGATAAAPADLWEPHRERAQGR